LLLFGDIFWSIPIWWHFMRIPFSKKISIKKKQPPYLVTLFFHWLITIWWHSFRFSIFKNWFRNIPTRNRATCASGSGSTNQNWSQLHRYIRLLPHIALCTNGRPAPLPFVSLSPICLVCPGVNPNSDPNPLLYVA
jgi:hypothetical protein